MSEPVHIAHIVYRLAIAGMESGLVKLVNRMDSRFVHHVISLADATDFQARITNPAVKVSMLNKKSGKDIGSYLRLWHLLWSQRVDIVHTRKFDAVDCGLVARLAGVKTLIHSVHGWDMSDLSGGNPKYIRLRRWMALLATRWLAVSANIRDWLEQAVGVKASKLTHIYNGVDAERFYPQVSSSKDKLHVGFVGRLEEVKNPTSMIRAIARLATDTSLSRPVELTVVGSGALLEPLKELARELGSEDVVHFSGPRTDVPELMRTFDAFVLSSFNERISNTILEAMATGLPVVATEAGGNPELNESNVSGQLYPGDDDRALAEALIVYANNESLRAEQGRAARQRVDRQFTLAVMITAYENFYSQCLNREYGT